MKTTRESFPPGKIVTLKDDEGDDWKFVVAAPTRRGLALRRLNPEYIKLIEQRTNVTPGLNLT